MISKSNPNRFELKKTTPENFRRSTSTCYYRKEDTQLFETLYDRHYGSVYRHCLRFFKNKQDAEDLSQEIFFKVFLKLNAFSFKSKF